MLAHWIMCAHVIACNFTTQATARSTRNAGETRKRATRQHTCKSSHRSLGKAKERMCAWHLNVLCKKNSG